ncbi:MAG TPA: hypothetical protein VGY77_06840, partial [Gemmataceae bacterium]|nr:hypothetical protein [Gemmataceae bacterium]
ASQEQSQTQARLERLGVFYNKHLHRVAQKREEIEFIAKKIDGEGVGSSSFRQQYMLKELADSSRELRRLKLAKTAAQVRVARNQKNKTKDKEAPAITAKLEEELDVLAEQEKLLQEEVKSLLEKGDKRDALMKDLEPLRKEIEQVEKVLERLEPQMNEVKMNWDAPPRVRLLQGAEVEKGKLGPSKDK